jgi:hypothetical protein
VVKCLRLNSTPVLQKKPVCVCICVCEAVSYTNPYNNYVRNCGNEEVGHSVERNLPELMDEVSRDSQCLELSPVLQLHT